MREQRDSTRVIIYALTQRYFLIELKLFNFCTIFFIIHVRFKFCFLIDITDEYIYDELMIITLFSAILIDNLSNADICTL